jgi:hypothetical protein
MAALYPMRPAGSYTTPWDTISIDPIISYNGINTKLTRKFV